MNHLILSILLSLIGNECPTNMTPICLDNDKVLVWEYWKVKNHKLSQEFMIYNPTSEDISVVFRNAKKSKELTPQDTLLQIPCISSNDYIIIQKSLAEFENLYHRHFSVIVNNEFTGYYSTSNKVQKPTYSIKNGIITNRRVNCGSNLPVEIVYENFVFKDQLKTQAKVVYLTSKFHQSGFSNHERSKNQLVDINILESNNLIPTKDDWQYPMLGATELVGDFIFEATKKINNDNKIQYLSFGYKYSKSHSVGFAIAAPFNVNFKDKSRYFDIK